MRSQYVDQLRKIWDTSTQPISRSEAALLFALNAQMSVEARKEFFETIVRMVLELVRVPQDGYTPIKGKDYFDGETPTDEEILALIKPLLPTRRDLLALITPLIPGKDEFKKMIEPLIPRVRDGKDADPPSRATIENIIRPIILEYVEKLPKEAPKPTYDQIKGVAEPIIRQLMTEARKGWFGGGGGGDLVGAGSGIAITTNNIGRKIISVTNPGGGAAVETPPQAVNGVRTQFTVSAEPSYVVADGITYFDGAGYTYAALTITMDNPPAQYIRVFV